MLTGPWRRAGDEPQRWRRVRIPRSVRDPVGVLRRIIEPSDGVDRSLVEMLAEEEGVSRTVVGVTLERLRRDGTLRAERGADGEEVLAWSDPE